MERELSTFRQTFLFDIINHYAGRPPAIINCCWSNIKCNRTDYPTPSSVVRLHVRGYLHGATVIDILKEKLYRLN